MRISCTGALPMRRSRREHLADLDEDALALDLLPAEEGGDVVLAGPGGPRAGGGTVAAGELGGLALGPEATTVTPAMGLPFSSVTTPLREPVVAASTG